MSAFDYDMISRYVEGEMNQKERSSFEQLLKEDGQLRAEVELYREVNNSLRQQLHPDEGAEALSNTMADLRNQYFSKETGSQQASTKLAPIRQITWKRWLAAAATIVLIIAALTIWSPWKKDLYQQYAYNKMPAVEERGAGMDSLLKIASINFNAKKYTASLPLFELVLKEEPQNAFAHFYYGIALLESGEGEKARQQFSELYNGSSIFKYEAAFYMALSFLKEKDRSKTKEWLGKIPADAGVYDKAQRLAGRL